MNKMTKFAVLPLIMALGVGFSSIVSAANDCNAKRAALEEQIKQAEKYGNDYKIAGLKRGLGEVNAHCTSDSVLQDAQRKVSKLEGKLKDNQSDVSEVQADLSEAQARGDAKKVSKYQSKLQEKQADVTKVTEELRQARAEVTALQG